MSEEYRFMRYYLPGSLFIIYMILLVIVNLPTQVVRSISSETMIGIFTGAFIASPTVGYAVYAFYNHLYEYWAADSSKRPALKYIENLTFIESDKRELVKSKLNCFTQKKEFLDLIYHSSLNNGVTKIDPKILDTLKNHLSAFSARVVCGLFVPLLCIPCVILIRMSLPFFGLEFALNTHISFLLVVIIVIFSFALLLDCKRVLYEAYQLEAYIIKTKHEEVKKLIEDLFLKRE